MNVLKFSEYTGNAYTNPDGDIDPKFKKELKYNVDKCKFYYSLYLKNKTYYGFDFASKFDTIRLYGMGNQPKEKYMNILSTSSQATGSGIDGNGTDRRAEDSGSSREGWDNVLWDIVSPAPKIANKIHDVFDDIDYTIIGSQIDSDSGAEEESKKWQAWVNFKWGGELNKIRAAAGLPLDDSEIPFESYEELQIHESAGGFKSNYSRIIEKLMKFTEQISKYGVSIKKKLIDDLRDLKVSFIRAYYDEEDNYVKYRYCDPEDVLVLYSKYDDFSDSSAFGEFTTKTISEIRYKCPDLKDEDWGNIAKMYCGYKGNPSETEWNDYISKGDYNVFNGWRIAVLDMEWMENDIDYNVVTKTKNGSGNLAVYKKTRETFNSWDSKKQLKINKRFIYGCKWLVGTEYGYDYGRVYDQIRDNPRKPLFSFTGVKIPGISLTQQLMPIYDNIQIAWLKYQNSLSIVFEEGWALDLKMIANVTDGGKAMSLSDVIGMWKSQGIMPFMSQPAGFSYQGGAVLPVHKLPGGMGQRLQEAILMWDSNMKKIEDLTGLNSVALGGLADPNATVRNTQMAVNSAASAIKPLINATFVLKSDASNIAAQKLRVKLKHDKDVYKAYSKLVGEKDVELLKQMADSAERFGIMMIAMPTEQDRQALYGDISIALQTGSINLADSMLLRQQISDGENLREIQNRLAYKIMKNERIKQRQSQQTIQMQGQIEAERDQRKAQFDMATKKMEVEGQVMVDKNKGNEERKTTLLKSNTEHMKWLNEKALEEQSLKQQENQPLK